MIAAGLLIIVFAGRGAESLGAFFIFWGVLIACHALTATVHELGHAVAACSVGMTVSRVTIGSGPVLANRAWQNVRIELRTFLLTGGETVTYFRDRAPEKWRYAVMIFGGVGANLSFIALTVLCITILAASKLVGPVVMGTLYAILASQVAVVLANLWPRNISLGYVRHASDGKLLLDTFRSRTFNRDAHLIRLVSMGRDLLTQKRYEEARRSFENACALFPDTPYLLSDLIHSTAKVNGPEAALQCYLDRKEMLGAASEANKIDIAWVHTNAAWNAVLTERKDLLPLADELLQKARKIMPDQSAVQATEAALRVRMGDLGAGSELLLKAVRSMENMDDKCDVAALLVQVERSGGDAALATEMARWVRYVETTI
jgi:hypothetical protein